MTPTLCHRSARTLAGVLAALAVAGCGMMGGRTEVPGAAAPERMESPPPPDVVGTYRRSGLLAHGEPLPFTGRVVHLATPTPDTTLALVTIALPNRALTFAHSGDSYRAAYEVTMVVARDGVVVDSVRAEETVVVPSFRESVRVDESILFQRQLRLAPAGYELRLLVRDPRGARTGTDTMMVDVPRLVAGTLGTPAPYYEMERRAAFAAAPRLLVTPRATVLFGREAGLPVYVEGYLDPDAADRMEPMVLAAVRGEDGVDAWRDSVALTRGEGVGARSGGRLFASGALTLPAARLGVGAATLRMWPSGGGDTVSVPIFVTFGDALPAATFDDMLSYLRYFASPARLEALRRTAPGERGAAWAAFLTTVGELEGTSGEQALRDYFSRIQVANQRYRDAAGPGWLSDRGRAFVAFGEPDQVEELSRPGMFQHGEVQRWSYAVRRLRLEFQDATGTGQWRLTPAGTAAFQDALARLRS